MKIPRYAPRLDCMIFKGGFERDSRDLTETLDIVSNACSQVQHLRTFIEGYEEGRGGVKIAKNMSLI